MTPTEQDKELQEQLLETILSILGITDRSSGNRPEQIATLEQEIAAYITSYTTNREREARISELKNVVKLPGHYSARDYDAYCHNRIAALQKERQ